MSQTILLLCFFLAGQEVKPDESGMEARVSIVVLDSFGSPLPGASITLDRAPGANVAGPPQGASELKIPYGSHRIWVEKPGYSPSARSVEVSHPREVFVFGLPPAWVEGGVFTVVEGKLLGFRDRPNCMSIRLTPVVAGSEVREAVVTRLGSFTLERVSPGAYFAVVAGPHGICSVNRVTINLAFRQDLTISVVGDSGKIGDTPGLTETK